MQPCIVGKRGIDKKPNLWLRKWGLLIPHTHSKRKWQGPMWGQKSHKDMCILMMNESLQSGILKRCDVLQHQHLHGQVTTWALFC